MSLIFHYIVYILTAFGKDQEEPEYKLFSNDFYFVTFDVMCNLGYYLLTFAILIIELYIYFPN